MNNTINPTVSWYLSFLKNIDKNIDKFLSPLQATYKFDLSGMPIGESIFYGIMSAVFVLQNNGHTMDGHFLMLQLVHNSDRKFTFFIFDPHGTTMASVHYDSVFNVLQLFQLYAKHYLDITIIIRNSICPQYQLSLGLCILYGVYWAIAEKYMLDTYIYDNDRRNLQNSICKYAQGGHNIVNTKEEEEEENLNKWRTSLNASNPSERLKSLLDKNRLSCNFDIIALLLIIYVIRKNI